MKTTDSRKQRSSPSSNGNALSNGGQNFGGDNEMPQLPADLQEKIKLANELYEQINQELKELTFSPGGEPVIPPGLPSEVIFKDEIERIKDTITGKYRLPPGIRIADIEMTQSTQFFNFDSLSSGAGADNSVPLVANKDLIIRIYVDKRPGLAGYVPSTVTGRIRFAGKEFTPLNGPLSVRMKNLIRRSDINHTLNFRIPAALCYGNKTFEVRVYDDSISAFGGIGINIDGTVIRRSSTSESFTTTFRAIPPLKVCGVMVNYVGAPNFNLAAPLGTDLPETLSRFLPMFPIHGFDFGPCTVTPWGDDMRINSGTKGSGWDSLLTFITNLRNASTVRAFYVGLLPTNLSGQLNVWQRGIGRPGVAIAAKDDTRALSHELGHAMTLNHLEDGMADGPYETNYPKYKEGTFPYGSIGEFGLNTKRMTLFDPNDSYDLMTYFDAGNVLFPTNTWISPYHYQRMMNSLKASDGTGDIFIMVSVVIIANFRVHRDGKVEVLTCYVVDRVNTIDNTPTVDSIILDIHGANGEILRSHRCHRHNPYQEMDGPFVDYHEVIPWSEDFSGFSIIRDGERIHTVERGNTKAAIKLEDYRRIERNGDMVHLKWSIEHERIEQLAMIRYSNDNGESWQAIAADLKDASHLVNLDLLPGGKECRLEIIGSGLHPLSVKTEAFEVRIKPRKAYIYAPKEGDKFQVGTDISLLGGGYSPDHDRCGVDEVSWHSNIQGYLGSGISLVTEGLIKGNHYITLSLPDGIGGEAKAGVWIRITDKENNDNCDCREKEKALH